MPTKLLKQLDNLVLHDLSSRSDVIRQAVLQYVRDPANALIADPKSVAVDKMYEYIKADYPYLDREDVELVKFFYGQKKKKKL